LRAMRSRSGALSTGAGSGRRQQESSQLRWYGRSRPENQASKCAT